MTDRTSPEDRIVSEMEPLDWLGRYAYLIRLGEDLTAIAPDLKTDDYAIAGCQSQVWVVATLVNGKMHFQGTSDAKITRGILALVFCVVEGQRPDEVARAEWRCLRKIGLSTALSPSRANGLAAILQRIRQLAEAFCS